jgi:hypothetical protein
LTVFHRPLALVGALTGGDLLLWNWSLSANHDVLALIAGVTLLPLAAACLLLAALTALQLASRFSRHPLVFAVLRRAVRPPRPRLRPQRHVAISSHVRRHGADAEQLPRRAPVPSGAQAHGAAAHAAQTHAGSAERGRKLAA